MPKEGMEADGRAELAGALNSLEAERQGAAGELPSRNQGGQFENKTQKAERLAAESKQTERAKMEKLSKDMPEIFGNLLDEEDEDGMPTDVTEAAPTGAVKETTSEQPAKETSAARKEALKVLAIDGWEEADFEGMPDSRVVAMSKKRGTVHRDVNKRMEELAALKKGTAAGSGAKGEQQGAVAEGEASPKGEPANALEAAVKGFEEFYGQEATEGLRKFGEAMQAEFGRQLEQRDQMIAGMLLNETRRQLLSEIPELGESEVWEQVQTKMQKLSGDYEDPVELMRDATELVLKAAGTPSRTVQQAKRNGSMSTPRRQNTGTSSKDEAGFAAFKAIMAGKPFDEVVRVRNAALGK